MSKQLLLITPTAPPEPWQNAARARYAEALIKELERKWTEKGEIDWGLMDRIESVLWPQELGTASSSAA